MKKISLLIGICAVLIIGCAFAATLIAGQVFHSEPSVTISKLQAKEIALQDAGEDFETVTFTRNFLESEHDRVMYRVEFYSDEMSYLYKIDGDTGSIYHREAQRTEHVDSQMDSSMQQPVSSEEKSAAASGSLHTTESTEENALKYIGVKRAQEIVLKDAGLSRDSVDFEKTSLDQEDGITVYDIHFQSGGVEYEYKVKALDGYLLEKEIEAEDSSFRNQKKIYDDDDDDDNDDDDDDDDDD